MSHQELPSVGVFLSPDVEYRDGCPHPYRACVRWVDPDSKRRTSRSESADTQAAQVWIDAMMRAARGGVDPIAATMKLAEYGEAVMTLALRGLASPPALAPSLAPLRIGPFVAIL